MKNEELLLTDLINAELLQKLQDAFSDMTGMAALTADKNGAAVTKGSNFTDFCTKYTRQNPKGRLRCEGCDKMGAHLAIEKGESCAYYCHAGLVDFAAPIMANGEMVGSFIGGQVLTSPPDLEKFGENADEMGIDRDEYIEAVKKIRIVDMETIGKAAKFLYVIAGVLSSIAYNGYRLYQSNLEIEKAAQAKSDFLANMSHEIRTPMNAVLGLAEMALREEMSPAAREYIHQIKFSGNNLLVIINDILDFSKIESGKMEISVVTYEPMSMINDLASIVCSRIGSKNIEFTMDISSDIPNKLLGDNIRIQQILINLLNNAVKFTKQGQVHLKFECEYEGDDTAILKAAVSDTGSGIKQDDLSKLFKSFQQVDSKRNRNIEGAGLGLAISRQLLDLMGGSISVESEYNKGSTFSFRLPQKIVSRSFTITGPEKPISVALIIENVYVKNQIINDLEKVSVNYVDIQEAASINYKGFDYLITERRLFNERLIGLFSVNSAVRYIVIENFSDVNDINRPDVRVIRKPVYYLNLYAALGIINDFVRENSTLADDFSFVAPDAQVLIVDDNSINLVVAKGLIQPLNMQVDTASSAAETIEKINKKNYDLIFMDHMMPEVDGVETTHIIRRLMPSYANVPIIALTANAVEGTREMFIREGMNDFVAKPINTKEIIAALRKWLPQEKIMPPDGTKNRPDNISVTDIKGLNVHQAISMLGSEELFMAVLKEYYCSIDKRSAMIDEYRRKGLIKNYTIEVHSLKSTSKQIGADELSLLAARLEKAGNENDTALIEEKTDEMLDMYLNLKSLLSPYFPECSSDRIKKEADPVQIMNMLEELEEALDNFDTLMIDDVIEKMSEYKYEDVFNEFFMQLRQAAEDSDIDMCSDIARQWRTDIAQLYIDR